MDPKAPFVLAALNGLASCHGLDARTTDEQIVKRAVAMGTAAFLAMAETLPERLGPARYDTDELGYLAEQLDRMGRRVEALENAATRAPAADQPPAIIDIMPGRGTSVG